MIFLSYWISIVYIIYNPFKPFKTNISYIVTAMMNMYYIQLCMIRRVCKEEEYNIYDFEEYGI